MIHYVYHLSTDNKVSIDLCESSYQADSIYRTAYRSGYNRITVRGKVSRKYASIETVIMPGMDERESYISLDCDGVIGMICADVHAHYLHHIARSTLGCMTCGE